MKKEGIEAYIELLQSFRGFFNNQSRILYKEIKTIKYAANYYRQYEAHYKDSKENLSQEVFELENIYDGIRSIEEKATHLRKQFKKSNNSGDFIKIINNINKRFDNSHISILPIIDSKINQFKELFDELNFYKQSYFNLIDSKEFSYIPSPKFNKRFRNANLGLYLNKQLNNKTEQSYRSLVAKFYKVNDLLENQENDLCDFNRINFFSTWSYSTDHYIKNFNAKSKYTNNKNTYIAMSYAYLDKTIFQPIAYHEISHAMKHKELSSSNKKYLEDSLFTFKNKNIFKKNNPLDDLHKEILCDLSAVYATGYSYIISLIHIGFFELESLFLKYKEFNPSDDIKATNLLFKIPSNEEIIPKKLDFNINNIYLAVRFLILIKLCEKIGIKNTYINGIKYMLNIIFPEDSSQTTEPSFLTIYEFLSTHASDYKQSRNLIYSLSEKFQSILFTKSLINNFKVRKAPEKLKSFVSKIENNNKDIHKLIKNNNKQCTSIYDILWLAREHDIKYDNAPNSAYKITERDINRLYNICDLYKEEFYLSYCLQENKLISLKKIHINKKLIKNFFNYNKSQFYNLELIKYKSTKNFHPFVEFMNIKKDDDYFEKISYIFAPYDIAYLQKVEYKDNIESSYTKYPFRETKKTLETNKYFIDRHSLFLLEEIETKQDKKAFDLIIQIKLDDIFSKQYNTDIFNFLLEYFNNENNIELFYNCKIFKSLGGEDYLIYLSGISIYNTKRFGKELKFKVENKYNKNFIEIEDLILLNNPKYTNIGPNSLNKNLEIISFAKINKNHSKSNDFLIDNLDKDKEQGKLLPYIKSYNLMKIPTNRFDLIINWYEQKDVFQLIKKYLEATCYSEEKDDKNFFSDFNIEIMHSYLKNM